MAQTFDVEEVAKHTSPESCWVILYGNVYDVTDFLSSHPGGSKVILRLAGRDATEEYDPIHPPGTLEENLKPEAKLGRVSPDSLARAEKAGAATAGGATDLKKEGAWGYVAPPLESLLNAHDIEAAATKQMSKRAWAYYYSAGDDLWSKEFNNTVYRSILLRPRIFVDITKIDTTTTLLGHPVGTPLYVSPAAMARLGHPDGERGIATGISRFGAAQLISNNSSMTPEQIVEGARPGQVFGWQLYVQNDRHKSEAMLRRVAALPQWFKFVVLTLDAPWPGKREHDERLQWEGATAPKPGGGGGGHDLGVSAAGKPLAASGSVAKELFFGTAMDLTWQTTLTWLAAHTSLPIVLKGVQTHEDAYLAMRHADSGNVRAIILSNHGGRALDTAPPAVHTLLEIRRYCPEVFTRLEVWVDGGVKRGTDVVKALCLGARGVGIGRLPLFGLGAGGAKGVERVFEIFQAEIETCMKLLGANTIADLGPRFINTRAVERDIFDGDAGLDRMGLWAQAKL